jgi:DNA-binding NarL/FixJ family response regulator
MKKIRIGIADDHSLLLEGMARIFSQDDLVEVVVQVSDGEQLLDKIKNIQIDLILLDITMPGRGGQSIAAELLRKYPDLKIVMLTMHQTPEYVLPLVDMGVHGFVLKNSNYQDLHSAIRVVMEGKKFYSEEVLNVMNRRNIREEQDEIQITRREREVLQLLYKGLSTVEMGEALFISQHTVFKHRQNLLQKCDCKSAHQLINLAISKGWITL